VADMTNALYISSATTIFQSLSLIVVSFVKVKSQAVFLQDFH
jgi:hypothetical protein